MAKLYFLLSKEKYPPDSICKENSISTWINKNKLLSNGYVNQQQSWPYIALDISLIQIKGSYCIPWGDVSLLR